MENCPFQCKTLISNSGQLAKQQEQKNIIFACNKKFKKRQNCRGQRNSRLEPFAYQMLLEKQIPQATSCSATHVASVNLTSKLAFYIHNFGVKNYQQKKSKF